MVQDLNQVFTSRWLAELFPQERTDRFFDALLGDSDDGAYDIRLTFESLDRNRLNFAFELHQRPGRCLACNLTHGLPMVFSRHPVINVSELVAAIDKRLDGAASCQDWNIGATETINRGLHRIPLVITLAERI